MSRASTTSSPNPPSLRPATEGVCRKSGQALTPNPSPNGPEGTPRGEPIQEDDAVRSLDFFPSPKLGRGAGFPGTLAAGAGKTTLPESTIPEDYIGDNVLVTLSARAQSDDAAAGRFAVTHRKPGGELVADARGEIDCMRTEGDYAVLTGVVTYANAPDVPEDELYEGIVVAIVVQDSDQSGDTMVWRFGDSDLETDCTEIPTVTAYPVEQGNFVVLD